MSGTKNSLHCFPLTTWPSVTYINAICYFPDCSHKIYCCVLSFYYLKTRGLRIQVLSSYNYEFLVIFTLSCERNVCFFFALYLNFYEWSKKRNLKTKILIHNDSIFEYPLKSKFTVRHLIRSSLAFIYPLKRQMTRIPSK